MRLAVGFVLLVVALGSAACDDVPRELLVDLKTDYVPGEEFVQVHTALYSSLPEAGGTPLATAERSVESGEDFIVGVRIAELSLADQGSAVLETRLLDRSGVAFATRVTRVALSGNSIGVTVLISRDCALVTCPDSGNSECFGGVCVSPECVGEMPVWCGPTVCEADADCSASRACAEGRCVAGACLTQGVDARCAVDEYCDPDLGCRPSMTRECPAGSADCNRDRADGCEADLTATTSCGDCATVCDSGLGCTSGGCEERLVWDHTFGDVEYDSTYALAVVPDGRLLVSGNFRGTVDLLGAGSRTASTMSGSRGAAFIAGLTAETGEHQWDNVYQGANMFSRHDIVPTGADSVLFLGQHELDVDFGGGVVRVVEAASAWLVSLNTIDGSWRWNYTLEDQTAAIATAPDGSSFTATRFVGVDDFGGGRRTSPGSITSIITALDPDGGYLWDQILGGVGPDWATDIVYAPDGRLFVCGYFQETVDFGGGARTAPDPMVDDAYVLGLAPDGNHLWDRHFSSVGAVNPRGMKLAPDGSLRIVGYYSDGTDFGAGTRSATDLAGFVLALSTDGAHLWDRTVDATTGLILTHLAMAADGRMWISGHAEGDYDLGDGPRTSTARDAFVWALEADGTTRWSHVFGGPGNDTARTLAIGGGMVFLAGQYDQDIDLGLGVRAASGMQDSFIVAMRDAAAQ